MRAELLRWMYRPLKDPLSFREVFSIANAPEQSTCRPYWHSGSSIVSCKASTAFISPLREEKSDVCSSMRSVMSSERWTPITETFRHRDSISEANASMRKFNDVTSSSRGLFN